MLGHLYLVCCLFIQPSLCTGENLFTWTTETGPRPSQLLCCLLLGETRASSPLWEGASRAAAGPSNLGWTFWR